MTSVPRDVLRTVRVAPVFAFYAAATLVVAAIIGLITVDVIDLGMAHFGQASHRTHDITYGALFTTLVVGVLAQVRRPGENVAGMVMAMVPGAALLLAAVLADDLDRVFEFNPFRYAAAVAVVAALVHPAGRSFFRSFRLASTSWPMVILVAVAAVPLLTSASTNVRLQRTVSDAHSGMGHYGFMAALSYTVIGVGLLASLRPLGWRLTAWVAGLLPIALGLTSLLSPDATSSLSTGWALAATAWGVAFIATSRLRRVDRPNSVRSGDTSDITRCVPPPVGAT